MARIRARWVLALGFLSLGIALRAGAQSNVIVFLTDDQRFDTLWAMPLVQQELVARGVRFEEAFVTTPMCCPSRSSLLSGGWLAQQTGVVDNAAPNGGFAKFRDVDSLAVALQGAGYATALVGKYLNGYEQSAPYVPPGWTLWHAALGIALDPTQFVIGSSTTLPSVGSITPTIHQYGTDYLRDQALAFVDAHAEDPFFLYLSFGAPHTPGTPATEDAALFPGYVYRGRAYGEADVSDKPYRVQVAQSQFPAVAGPEDEFHRDQLRTLQAVDRAVKAVVDRVVAHGLLGDTVFVFASDNGYLWGEHNLIGKGDAYEEATRVPLVVVAPGIAPRTDTRLVASNLDIAATVRDVAGLAPVGEGQSLLPLLADPDLPGRSETLIEQVQPWRVWAGLRVRDASGDWKYIEDSSGGTELYDLVADPYEEQNLASAPVQQARRADFAARLAPRKGLAITSHFVVPYAIDQPYTVQIRSWGVRGTPTWSVAQGSLPSGLTLDAATGVVSGTTSQPTPSSVLLRLEDSAVSPQSGRRYVYDQNLVFGPPACSDTIDNDGDGKVDLLDGGCSAATDAAETDSSKPCDDALDNDVDGKIDSADPGCAIAPFDKESRKRACGLGGELPVLLLAARSIRRRISRASGPSPTRRAV